VGVIDGTVDHLIDDQSDCYGTHTNSQNGKNKTENAIGSGTQPPSSDSQSAPDETNAKYPRRLGHQ
jgi:hypothetical protein